MVYKVLWRNVLPIKPGTPQQTHSLFDKCTGFFDVRYMTRPMALRPIRRHSIVVKCLAFRTQVLRLGLEPTLCWSETSGNEWLCPCFLRLRMRFRYEGWRHKFATKFALSWVALNSLANIAAKEELWRQIHIKFTTHSHSQEVWTGLYKVLRYTQQPLSQLGKIPFWFSEVLFTTHGTFWHHVPSKGRSNNGQTY